MFGLAGQAIFMDNNEQNQYGSQNQFGGPLAGQPQASGDPGVGGQSSVPPPPPSTDERVSVRTMASDVQSVRETGGQMPQSQMVNAPEIPSMSPDSLTFSPVPAPAPTSEPTPSPAPVQAQATPGVPDAGGVAAGVAEPGPVVDFSSNANASAAAPVAAGSKTKTILFVVGAVVLAVLLGFGAYYLAVSLTAPSVAPAATSSPQLPVAVPTTTPSPTPSQQPTVIQPMAHVSLILSPTQTESVGLLSGSGAASIRSAIAAAAGEQGLSPGDVKDLSITDASSSPVQSSVILPAYFPSFGPSLGGLIEPDFTSWIYFDKTGGSKLGFVFKLTAAAQSATTTIGQYIESNPADLANLFLATTTVPKAPVFKDGLVGGVHVRFLAYNVKLGRVIEYGFLTGSDGSVYLLMATSYNQMVDIVNRLKANPSVVSPASLPSAATSSASSTR